MEEPPKTLASLLLLAVTLTAAPARAESRVATVCLAPFRYLGARGLDLLDVVELNVGAGRGVKADVKYAVHFFGFGEVRSHRLGIMDRRAGVWREVDTELCLFPVSLLAYPVGWGARAVGASRTAWYAEFIAVDGTAGFQHLDRKELNGEYGFLWKDTVSGYRHTRWGDSFPIGAEVHLYVGARAAARPLQLVDFFTSLVGVDLDPWLNATP
jgi:hypothetical protein